MPVDPATGQPLPGWGSSPYPTYNAAPLPFNPNKAAAQHAYQQATAALANQKAETLDYYGYTAKGRRDPKNVYGAFQMQGRAQGQQMNELYGAQSQAGLVGGVGGNQGLARQQRNTALFAQGFEQSQMLKEFQAKMNAIRMGRQEARWQKQHTSNVSGTLQSILNAISAGQFTPAAPVGGGY